MHGMTSTLLTMRLETKIPSPYSIVLLVIFSAYYTLMLPHFHNKVVELAMVAIALEIFVFSVYYLQDDLNFVKVEVKD